MFAIGIIIFREVLEMVLIISVLLVATKDLCGRGRWLGLGIAGGFVGSGLVAVGAGAISNSLSGVGQEVLNAGILAASSLMIIWTVVWMQTHAKQLTAKMKEVGKAVCVGSAPVYALSTIAALAILREGSEVVLFTMGVIAQGTSVTDIFVGSTVGVVAGLAVGVMLYLGLVRISVKHFFSCTSALLTFLAAAMMSQGVAFLSAAGWIPEWGSPLWDTSRYLSEQSVLGQVFHVLLGYRSKPTGVEVVTFITVIGVIMMLLKKIKMNPVVVLLAGLSLCVAGNAHASKKVYSPYVEKGEWELEFRGGYTTDDRLDGQDDKMTQKYAVGYGVTDRWFTEIYGELERTEDESLELEAYEWENRFQLTEQGQYAVDLGLYVAYAFARESHETDEAEVKILLEKSFDSWSHTANIKFSQEVGAHSDGSLEAGLSWKSKYRLNEYVQPGFEYYGAFGELHQFNSLDSQQHQMGPVLYGALNSHVKYEVGYLWGLSEEAPDGEVKACLEYEFRF